MFLHLYSYFWRMFDYVRVAFGTIPRTWRGSRWFYLGLHYFAVLIVFGILAYFSDQIVLNLIGKPLGEFHYVIRRCWAGWVFLLIYLTIRLGLYLISLLRASAESDWPEIDSALNGLMVKLKEAGIAYETTPLFLVTGATPEVERKFLQDFTQEWPVLTPAPDIASPIRCVGDSNGLLLFCTGISASSLQAQNQSASQGLEVPKPFDGTLPPESFHPETTLGKDQPLMLARYTITAEEKIDSTVSESHSNGGLANSFKTLTSSLSQLLASSRGTGPQKSTTPVIRELTYSQSERCRLQMSYLAQKLLLNRTVCPFNGLLQIIPFDWIVNVSQQKSVVRSIHTDWSSIAETLEFQFPVTVMFSGLEKVDGFRPFLSRCNELNRQARLQRAGSGYPEGAEVDQEGAEYLSLRMQACFRNLVYPALLRNMSQNKNGPLFRFLCEISACYPSYLLILKALLSRPQGALKNVRFQGSYFAATGSTVDEQAFVLGVVKKLLESQNNVAYSIYKIRRDRFYKNLAYLVFFASTLLLTGSGYLLYEIWRESQLVS